MNSHNLNFSYRIFSQNFPKYENSNDLEPFSWNFAQANETAICVLEATPNVG